jgi:single-strand DNA-binding protein
MAYSLNKVQLIGNIGKDAELKYTPSSVAVASFSVATSEQWKDDAGNKQEKTEWHNIVAWRKLAEICGEYVKKGGKIYVEGKLSTRTYEKDGVKQYRTEIVADNIILLSGEAKPKQEDAEPPKKDAPKSGKPASNDDLPF